MVIKRNRGVNEPKITLGLTYPPFILNGLFHEWVVKSITKSIENVLNYYEKEFGG